MMREVDFVRAAIANDTDLISPETRAYLDGLDLASAQPQGALVDALSAELEKLDRRMSPERIVEEINEFKLRAACDQKQERKTTSGFASSTMVEGWQGAMPPSPHFEDTLFVGASAAAQVEGSPDLRPRREDPGGGTHASQEPLGEPPLGAVNYSASAPPPPSDEASRSAHRDRVAKSDAAKAASEPHRQKTGAIPKVRDSGLGTSAAASISILEESLRMVQDSAAASEWLENTMSVVERLEKAVEERRVSDVRRQRKEILPFRRQVEREFPREAQAWPAANRQAMLEYLTGAMEEAVTLADTLLDEGLQLDEVKNAALTSVERLLRLSSIIPDDATIQDVDLQRVNYVLEELRDECQELQGVLAPAQAGSLGPVIDADLVTLLRQAATKVAAAWAQGVVLRQAHMDAMAPGVNQRIKPLPLPAVATRGPYQFAPADVTILEGGQASSVATTEEGSSDDEGHQQGRGYVTAVDNSTLLSAKATVNNVTIRAAAHPGSDPAASAAPGGQARSRPAEIPPVNSDGRAVIQNQWAPFGGPPLATSEIRPADTGGRGNVPGEFILRDALFPPLASRGRGRGLPLRERSPGRPFHDGRQVAQVAGQQPFPIYQDHESSMDRRSGTDRQSSMDREPSQGGPERHLRFSEPLQRAADVAGPALDGQFEDYDWAGQPQRFERRDTPAALNPRRNTVNQPGVPQRGENVPAENQARQNMPPAPNIRPSAPAALDTYQSAINAADIRQQRLSGPSDNQEYEERRHNNPRDQQGPDSGQHIGQQREYTPERQPPFWVGQWGGGDDSARDLLPPEVHRARRRSSGQDGGRASSDGHGGRRRSSGQDGGQTSSQSNQFNSQGRERSSGLDLNSTQENQPRRRSGSGDSDGLRPPPPGGLFHRPLVQNPIDTRVIDNSRPSKNIPQRPAPDPAASPWERFMESMVQRIEIKEGRGREDNRQAVDNFHAKKLPYPKFEGVFRKYPRFKRDWENYLRHNLSQAGESTIVNCFLQNCLAKNIAEKVDQLETMREVWNQLDSTFSQAFNFERDIMRYTLPLNPLQDNDHVGVADYYTRLLSLFKESARSGFAREVVHPGNVDRLAQKLSNYERRVWAEYLVYYSRDIPKEEIFANFVQHRSKYAHAQQLVVGGTEIRPVRDSREKPETRDYKGREDRRDPKKAVVHALASNNRFPPKDQSRFRDFTKSARPTSGPRPWTRECILGDPRCSEVHHPAECKVFCALTPVQRAKIVVEKELCSLCFKHNTKQECFSINRIPACDIKGCGRLHHPLLHEVCKTISVNMITARAKVRDETAEEIYLLRQAVNVARPNNCETGTL